MEFKYERMPNEATVKMYIEKCEGKHIQQVVYSTYHKAFTQICFGCKKIRSTMEVPEDVSHESQETNLEDGVRNYTPSDNSAHEKSKSSLDANHELSEVEDE